jgi:hypothetical protein
MLIRLACLVLLILTAAGCGAITVAGAASVATIAGTAVDTGNTVFSMGKLSSTELATREQCRQAVRKTAEEMQLRVTTDKLRDDREVRFALVDDRQSVIDIFLDPRTPAYTEVTIDVGLFGSQTTATLLLNHIRKHVVDIRAATTQPATQP